MRYWISKSWKKANYLTKSKFQNFIPLFVSFLLPSGLAFIALFSSSSFFRIYEKLFRCLFGVRATTRGRSFIVCSLHWDLLFESRSWVLLPQLETQRPKLDSYLGFTSAVIYFLLFLCIICVVFTRVSNEIY